MISIEERLRELNIDLPPAPRPVGRFVHGVQHGQLLFMSGQGPLREDGSLARGKVGADVSLEEARLHARCVGLVLVSAMREMAGSLERIDRVIKLRGMVNAVPEFQDHPQVIDGCSDLLHDIFGARGEHARSAIGVASLPGGISVEIEAIVAVKPDN
ncbi:MAG TPA: RidA family protein [Afifellaceae bacterium]|nr:RidA family protein [Afifellaceae bacterium]